MTNDVQAVEHLKKAYRCWIVAGAASALAIKSNYRKVNQEVDPDRPTTQAATAAEAM